MGRRSRNDRHTNSTKTQLPLGSESGSLLNNGFDNIRFRRGSEIAHRKSQIQETDKFQYRVKSQSTSGELEVHFTELGWICSCTFCLFRLGLYPQFPGLSKDKDTC